MHDVGSDGVPLVPGMVLTLEPGLYVAEEALGIGGGRFWLRRRRRGATHDLPRAAEEIEEIMREDPPSVHSHSRNPRVR